LELGWLALLATIVACSPHLTSPHLCGLGDVHGHLRLEHVLKIRTVYLTADGVTIAEHALGPKSLHRRHDAARLGRMSNEYGSDDGPAASRAASRYAAPLRVDEVSMMDGALDFSQRRDVRRVDPPLAHLLIR